MDSVIEAKIKDYLINRLKYRPADCGAILTHIDGLAQMSGFTVDENFGDAGLGAGPEARAASGLVNLALGGGGAETSEYEIRQELNRWIRSRASSIR